MIHPGGIEDASRANECLRKYPFPYRAMLAVCSDLDETPDAATYYNTLRFLNTARDTPMGPGVNLEIGNSIYFEMPRSQFSYWGTDEAGRGMIHELNHSGHVDCLHSFGDCVGTRDGARRALDAVEKHGCTFRTWIDHALAPSNFGSDIMAGHGDEPGHPAYHADLTLKHGVQYVWRGRATSVIGQDVETRYGGLWRWHHPGRSSVTLTKEILKHVIASSPRSRYRPHRYNRILTPVHLRDGQKAYEFLRANPHWGGVSSCDTAAGISDVVTRNFLDRLVSREGTCILYTHLGKIGGRPSSAPFDVDTVEAFRRLAEYQHAGKILVTTTTRLLDYVRRRDNLHLTTTVQKGECTVQIGHSDALEGDAGAGWRHHLHGISIFCRQPESTRVVYESERIPTQCTHRTDLSSLGCLSVPWQRLAFPEG